MTVSHCPTAPVGVHGEDHRNFEWHECSQTLRLSDHDDIMMTRTGTTGIRTSHIAVKAATGGASHAVVQRLLLATLTSGKLQVEAFDFPGGQSL